MDLPEIRPGDLYESCRYHPVLCTSVDADDESVRGISLVDGSFPNECSVRHCGVRRLTLEEAVALKERGPADPEDAAAIPPEDRWWT